MKRMSHPFINVVVCHNTTLGYSCHKHLHGVYRNLHSSIKNIIIIIISASYNIVLHNSEQQCLKCTNIQSYVHITFDCVGDCTTYRLM